MTAFTEIDRLNLQDLAVKYPNHIIVIESCFMAGTIKEPCGFVPNESNGITRVFKYKD